MARIDYWQYLIDKQGNPLQNAEVRVYLAGTLIEANIFLDNTFGSFTQSSVSDLKTDIHGFFQFWIGDEWEVEGGYTVDQQFKLIWQNTIDSIQEEVDDIYVFAPVRPIEIGDSIQGELDNKDLNRVISNSEGFKWNNHVDSIVPSASPHDLEPVVFFNIDTVPNRVVSDKLGYQMYQMADRSSTTDIDISAARFYSERITTWDGPSGGLYYKVIRHDFNNYYPIVKFHKFTTDHQIDAKRVETIDPNRTRVWFTTNQTIRAVFFG